MLCPLYILDSSPLPLVWWGVLVLLGLSFPLYLLNTNKETPFNTSTTTPINKHFNPLAAVQIY